MDVVVVFYILDIIDYITSVAVSGYVFDEIVNVKLKERIKNVCLMWKCSQALRQSCSFQRVVQVPETQPGVHKNNLVPPT